MLKKTIHNFESMLAVTISGIFLIASLIFSLTDIKIPIFLNPAIITILISGTPLVYSAVFKLFFKKGISKISSALLISIAMTASVIIGDLFAAGEIAFIMAIGEILEEKTTQKAKKGLKKLISISPANARRISNGKEEFITAEKINVGDILRILPGETVPVDGEIIKGETSIDQSIMTGESLPADKTIGNSVFCGTINRFGSIDIKATAVGADSSLQKLISLVKKAESQQAPIQRIADKWASLLVPIALLLAIISGILKQDIIVAVTVLVVFCPCALVLATPTAVMAAIGQATRQGVIIKSGQALEKMGKADVFAFDKTGTLTHGNLKVCDIISLNKNLSMEKLLKITATAEKRSEHPLAKAILSKAGKIGLTIPESEDFRMFSGKGIFAKVENENIYCGNEKFLEQNGISIPQNIIEKLSQLRNCGKASIIVANENEVLGIIALSDSLKPLAESTIKNLHSLKTDTVLLTGDNEKTAGFFADKLNISQVKANLLPEQKVQSITELKNFGKTVCMIGDGVNDAPALKTADVGIAMGTMGSDIAVEAADIAIMGDDLSKLPYLKRLSIATVRTIKFSISLSLLINFSAIALSVLGILNPTTGALVHNAGSVIVVLIAAMLYDRKFEK